MALNFKTVKGNEKGSDFTRPSNNIGNYHEISLRDDLWISVWTW